MAHSTAPKSAAGKLPLLVASPGDVGRLLEEIEALNNAMMELDLRKSGAHTQLPKTSRLLEEMAKSNELNLLHKTDRERLHRFLAAVRERAPVLHMSFSADPSPTFMNKLMSWLRSEIHPQLLVTIGLQPTIGAGCIVRSTNKYFDFSLRQDFANKRNMLLEALIPDAKKATATHE